MYIQMHEQKIKSEQKKRTELVSFCAYFIVRFFFHPQIFTLSSKHNIHIFFHFELNL